MNVAHSPPSGPVLVVETSWDVGSVVLARDGEILDARFLTVRSRHADNLVPATEALLAEAGMGVSDLAGVVVGAGPGSFTGVRVAASFAKGFAFPQGLPFYPVSSLAGAALSLEAIAPGTILPEPLMSANDGGGVPPRLDPGQREIRYVLMDARQGRVYGGCYDVSAEDAVEVISPHGGTIVEVLNGRPPLGTEFVGPGAWAHANLIRAAGFPLLGGPCGIPTAHGVLRACTWEPVDPAEWKPEYVRAWRPG